MKLIKELECLAEKARTYANAEDFTNSELANDLDHQSNNWFQRKRRDERFIRMPKGALPKGDRITIYRSTARERIAPGDIVGVRKEHAELYLEYKKGAKLLKITVDRKDLKYNDRGDIIYAPNGITSLADFHKEVTNKIELEQIRSIRKQRQKESKDHGEPDFDR